MDQWTLYGKRRRGRPQQSWKRKIDGHQTEGLRFKMDFILLKMCLDGTQSKVRFGNYLSSSFPIENGLKQGDALLPLLFNVALEYAIRKIQETTWDWI